MSKKTQDVCYAAGVLILHPTDYGKYLLFRRKGQKGLSLPGGKKEQGETIKDAAIREIREEVGATVDLFAVPEGPPHSYCSSVQGNFVFFTYIGVLKSLAEPTHRQEGEAVWGTADDLRKGTFKDYNTKMLYAFGL